MKRRVVAAVSFVAFAGAGVALSATVASGRPILGARWHLLWLLGAWTLAWLAGVWALYRLPHRWIVPAILVGACAIRAAALAGPPTTSDDLYRYAWDGRVQLTGTDPYASPPDAPKLTSLREPWLWPGARGCAALDRPPGCTRINRPAVRTIYPPVAEAWFAAIYRLAGIGARHKAWQVGGLVVDMATVGALLVTLRRRGADLRWAAWYALCPAPVLEFVNNAHVDGLAVLGVIGAFAALASIRGSERRRDVAFGLLIGAAALVKIYPAALVLVLPSARRRLRAALSAAALATLTYLPHIAAAGVRVIGYLPGYLREEHYQQGGRFLLAGALGLHGHLAGGAAAIALVGAAAWVLARRPDPARAAVVLLVALFAATTPVQPWYAVSAIALGSLAGWPGVAAIAAAGYPYFFAVILDYRHATGLGRASYALGLIGVVASTQLHRRQIQSPAAEESPPPGGPGPRSEHRPQLAGPVPEGLQTAR